MIGQLPTWFVVGSVAALLVAMASEWLLFSTGRTGRPRARPEAYQRAVSELRTRLAEHSRAPAAARAESLVRLRESWMRVQDHSQCLDFESYREAVLELEGLREELRRCGLDDDAQRAS